MCKKLMFLISLVCVLGLVEGVFATDYTWTNDYPWSYLYVSPWNWEPVAPYGGPGSGDVAIIPSAGPIVLDTDIQVGEIKGPAWGGGADGDMYLIKDCNLIVEDNWRVEDTVPYTANIIVADNAKVEVRDRFYAHGDHQRVVMTLSDNAEFRVPDDDYFELNLTDNAYFYAGNDDDGFRQNEGEVHVNVSGNAVLEAEYVRHRCRSKGLTCTWTVSENGQVIVNDEHWRFAGGGSDVIVNVLDNASVDVAGDVIFAEDDSFAATATLNMNSTQSITMGGDLVLVADGDAHGFTTVNLNGGVIDVGGELDYDTTDWVINICGDGTLILDGDVVDDILAEAAAGRIVPCPQLDCRGEMSPRGDLMVDYNNVNPGKTTVWVELNLEKAWSPSPADGATGVSSLGVDLCWCPGDSAEVHHLFFSTDYDAVANRDPSAYVAPIHGHDNTCYPTGPLMLGVTYYWAVDEQDAGINIVSGDVWSFTVEQCRMIEDMESYNRNPNLIYDTWKDGCGDKYGMNGNGTGSCVDLSIDKIHSGSKSMIYTYENIRYSLWERDANYSEARREFDPALDLTSSGEAALVVWFHGSRDNGVTDMWLLLNDNVGAMAKYGDNGDDPADITKEEWIDWNINLADLAAGGVDLLYVLSAACPSTRLISTTSMPTAWSTGWTLVSLVITGLRISAKPQAAFTTGVKIL